MVSDELVETALKAQEACLSETQECGRCGGAGYHHGFGEHGHDPDWCTVCGGAGRYGIGDERSAMRAALEAAGIGAEVPEELRLAIGRYDHVVAGSYDDWELYNASMECFGLMLTFVRSLIASSPAQKEG